VDASGLFLPAAASREIVRSGGGSGGGSSGSGSSGGCSGRGRGFPGKPLVLFALRIGF
jgi:uncharacterized membrane protein